MTTSMEGTSGYPVSMNLLGDILIRMGKLDARDLHWAVMVAKDLGRPVFEVLEELELITPEQVQSAIEADHLTDALVAAG